MNVNTLKAVLSRANLLSGELRAVAGAAASTWQQTATGLNRVQTRGKATEAASGEDDFVLGVLKSEIKKFDVFKEECKKIYYPLGELDNDAKVKKFATEWAAAKKKAGVKPSTDRMQNLISFYKDLAGDNVREFFNLATPQMNPVNASAATAALDAVEAELGKPLLYSNKAGFEKFQKKIQVVAEDYMKTVKEKNGGKTVEEILKDYDFYEAKAHLKNVQDQAMEGLERVKQMPPLFGWRKELYNMDDKQKKDFIEELAAQGYKASSSDFLDGQLSLQQLSKMVQSK